MDPIDRYTYASNAPAFARNVLDFHPDPVQLQLLATTPSRCILNCTRQWGKSTVTAIKALHHALFNPHSLILVLSPSERQSGEFIRKVSELSLIAGRPLVELIRKLQTNCPFYPIMITSSDHESSDGSFYNVPKSHLLTALILQFEGGMLKISSGLELAETLLQELSGLRIKVSRAGNDIFSHESAAHDDLVFALALANWQATKDRWSDPHV